MIEILNKAKESGIETLNDDEIQFVRYIEIMNDDDHGCTEKDFSIEDDFCDSCDSIDACFLHEFNKNKK